MFTLDDLYLIYDALRAEYQVQSQVGSTVPDLFNYCEKRKAKILPLLEKVDQEMSKIKALQNNDLD